MTFKRFRDRRVTEEIRAQHRESKLHQSDFILPLFIVEGSNIKAEISSMPNVFHYSIDRLLPDLQELVDLGLKSVLLFGVPKTKGVEQSFSATGLVQQATALIKNLLPQLEVITDVCLCSYTHDGHCHIGRNHNENSHINDNDETCEILAQIALSHAKAGADIVAPSDMMDGRVHYINKALTENGLRNTKILSYAAKYASNYYGPFRDAADCAPQALDSKPADRKSYQMDYANTDEAIAEVNADIEEGADQIMIKPALSYLDIIYRTKQHCLQHNSNIPIVAYNVSGEYKMLLHSVNSGWANEDIIHESLLSIKRAGADRIVSYFTPYLLQKYFKS